MKDNDMIFTITDENGEEVTCEILFTFEHQETHKNYVIYTDDSLDEDGNTRSSLPRRSDNYLLQGYKG